MDRSKMVPIRIHVDALEAIDKAAAKAGMTRTAFLVNSALQVANWQPRTTINAADQRAMQQCRESSDRELRHSRPSIAPTPRQRVASQLTNLPTVTTAAQLPPPAHPAGHQRLTHAPNCQCYSCRPPQ